MKYHRSLSTLHWIVLLFLLAASPLYSRSIFVSPNGNDNSNTGTISSPYKTIQKAADVAVSGDVIEIREGIYRETVVPQNNGTSSNPIIYRSYNNETVIISGLEDVTSLTGSNWVRDSGDIYYLNGISEWTTSTINQDDMVFVDGKPMMNSYYPNNTSNNLGTYDYTPVVNTQLKWGSRGNLTRIRYSHSNYNNGGSNHYVGAKVIMTVPPFWYMKSGTVVQSGNGFIEVEYLSQYEDSWANWHNWFSLYGGEEHPVLLLDFKNGLDTANEYYLDESANRLYVWVEGGGNPSGRTIEVKRRDWGFDLSDRSYIEVNGINFIGCSITTDNLINEGTGTGVLTFRSSVDGWPHGEVAGASHITIDGVDVRYHFYAEDLSGSSYYQWQTGSGLILSGQDLTLKNSIIAFSSQNGVTTIGRRNTIDNNYIGYVSYFAGETGAITTSEPGTISEDMVITNNTMEYSGRSFVIGRGLKSTSNNRSKVMNNIMRHGVLYTDDGGAFYTFNNNTDQGLEIAYNIIHDMNSTDANFAHIGSVGIYLDSPHSNYNYTIHHNLVYNTAGGVGVNGTHHRTIIYNNTLHTDKNGIGSGTAYVNRWGLEIYHNLFSDASVNYSKEIDFGHQDNGNSNVYRNEIHNVQASEDPQFNSLAGFDFTLQNGSPAATATNVNGHASNTLFNAGYKGAFEPNQPAWTAGATVNFTDITPPVNNAPTIIINDPVSNTIGVQGIDNKLIVNTSIGDDGLPENSSVSITWGKVSGPGVVTFEPSDAENTAVSFSSEGDYEIKVSATDGALTTEKTITVNVYANPSGSSNSPVPGSGTRKDIWGENTYSFQTISDMENSANYPDNYEWTEIITTGLDSPSDWGNWYSVRFTGYFIPTETGIHTFYLLGDDFTEFSLSTNDQEGNLQELMTQGPSARDRWTQQAATATRNLTAGQAYFFETLLVEKGGGDFVQVGVQMPSGAQSFPIDNQYLSVPSGTQGAATLNYGSKIEASAPTNVNTGQSVSLSGTVTDDGQPSNATLTHQWSIISGPSTPNISSSTNTNASVNFSVNGTYVLRLASSDGEITTADDITINVGGASGWVAFASTESLDDQLPNNDTDGDGIVDFLEYALGGDPHAPDTLSKAPKLIKNGSDYEFYFYRASADATYTVQRSTDLVNWTDHATNPGSVDMDVIVTRSVGSTPIFFRLLVEE